MDYEGRPLEGGEADYQEIQRRYNVEKPTDYSYQLQMQKDKEQSDQFSNLDPNNKVPYIKGDKTILCWNCQTVLLVKEEWSVVQCTNCDKVNKIPGSDDLNSQIRMNDNLNHFDIRLPYVFILITCPFCRIENKARRDAEHIICYKCHNSFSILQEKSTKKEAMPMTTSMQMNNPNRIQRSNEMFFPQPPFNLQYQNAPFYQEQDPLEKQMENFLKLEMLKRKLERKSEPKISKFGALRDLIKTVNDIDEKRGTPGMRKNKIDNIYSDSQNGYYKDIYRSDRIYKSPLKSESVYRNIFDKKNPVIDSYQNYKKRDTIGQFDFTDFIMPPTNSKKYL